MFFVPVIVYIILTFRTSTNFALTPFQYLLIVIQGVFFSYLGSKFSLKGMEHSPNPGYSLIISKSYVIFTAIASIFLFSAPLTLKSAIAIVLVVLFSALIAIDKDQRRTTSNSVWLPYTIGAFFCWSFLALSSKYLLNVGVPILTRLILSMLITTLIIFGEILHKKVEWKKTSKDQLITLLLIGFLLPVLIILCKLDLT
jgi:drug/metabolite transporter (DMT)-like permease